MTARSGARPPGRFLHANCCGDVRCLQASFHAAQHRHGSGTELSLGGQLEDMVLIFVCH